jgi:hypothetical protein
VRLVGYLNRNVRLGAQYQVIKKITILLPPHTHTFQPVISAPLIPVPVIVDVPSSNDSHVRILFM